MATEPIVGLDVGTTGLKAVAIDETGAVLAKEEEEYPFATPQPGWAEQDPEDWWRAAQAALGRLDIVINNAGVITRGSVVEATDADWTLSVGVNVEAPFRICRAAIPILAAAGGGAIVNIASCWGLRPGPKHAVYCMTKAAIASLTQCMGMDHARENIRINAVAPNEVNTPMLRTGFAKRGFDPDTAVAELGKSVPLGRIAEPEDIVDVVLFLASEAARYICGSVIEVNGGKPVS